MKLSLTLFLIAFVGSLYANEAVFQELAQIKENPFGATILTAISSNMRMQTPINDIQNLLQQIRDNIYSDLVTLEAYYEEHHKTLTDSLKSNDDLISTLQGSITQLDEAIKADSENKALKEETLKNVQASLIVTQERLNTLEADYNTVIPNLDADIADVKAAIDACNLALEKMNTYRRAKGTALLQFAVTSQNTLKSFASMMDGMKSKLAKHSVKYSPLIHELVLLSQDFTGDKAERVVNLLIQLRDTLNQALIDLEAQKGTYVANYELQHGLATSELESLGKQETDLTLEIVTLTSNVNVATDQRSETQTILNDSITVRQLNQEALDRLEQEYGTEKPNLEKLIEIMDRLIVHFRENVAAVDEWTAGQINGL